MFQFFNLLPSLPPRRTFCCRRSIAGRRDEATRGAAVGLLERVGLGTGPAHLPAEMSGGEQQRVRSPEPAERTEIVLADEPTGNLDSRSSRGVLDLWGV